MLLHLYRYIIELIFSQPTPQPRMEAIVLHHLRPEATASVQAARAETLAPALVVPPVVAMSPIAAVVSRIPTVRTKPETEVVVPVVTLVAVMQEVDVVLVSVQFPPSYSQPFANTRLSD